MRNTGGGGRFPFDVSVVGTSSWMVDSLQPRNRGPGDPVPRDQRGAGGTRPGAYRAVLRFISPAGTEDVPIAFFVSGRGPAQDPCPVDSNSTCDRTPEHR